MKSVFLSHNKNDKMFVRRLASDLEFYGIKIWLDEAEIRVGDSLINKISEGIGIVDFLAVILSPNSIHSTWVQREVSIAMTQEINEKIIKVLPILYKKCELPLFLIDKKYADFTNDLFYKESLKELVESIGIVFNNDLFKTPDKNKTLGNAIDKAYKFNLPLFCKPFHRPFQYIGMLIKDASKEVNQPPNDAGNIIVESDDCRMLLESEGNFISYVDIELLNTAPWSISKEFDSESILGAFSINPSEYEFAQRQTHFHTYYDHKRKLKIGISCSYEGGPLSIGFSSKWYGS